MNCEVKELDGCFNSIDVESGQPEGKHLFYVQVRESERRLSNSTVCYYHLTDVSWWSSFFFFFYFLICKWAVVVFRAKWSQCQRHVPASLISVKTHLATQHCGHIKQDQSCKGSIDTQRSCQSLFGHWEGCYILHLPTFKASSSHFFRYETPPHTHHTQHVNRLMHHCQLESVTLTIYIHNSLRGLRQWSSYILSCI